MKNKDTIYCCYHNISQYNNDNPLVWVYGPNDPLNKYLSEFSMYKYILENDKDSDIIGVCHYKRSFNIYNPNYIDNDNIIVYAKMRSNKIGAYSIRKWCDDDWFQSTFLYYDWLEYLPNVKYYLADEYCASHNCMISRSSFISTRYHFIECAKYILGMFDFIDNKYSLNHDPILYKEFIDNWYTKINKNTHALVRLNDNIEQNKYRLFAYFGEWLVCNYIVANFKWKNIHAIHDQQI